MESISDHKVLSDRNGMVLLMSLTRVSDSPLREKDFDGQKGLRGKYSTKDYLLLSVPSSDFGGGIT